MSSSQSMAHDEAMHRYEEQYDALKAKLQAVGFIGQGSVQTRRIACGSPTCRCHHDPDARHGPYHYWTRKARGKTVGLKLTEDELGLYREWIENNRELERLVEEMRRISSRVACPHHRQAGSMNPRGSGSPATVAVTVILRTLRPSADPRSPRGLRQKLGRTRFSRARSGCRPSSWLLPMRPQRLRAHPPGGSDRVDEDVVGGRQAAAFGLLPAFMNVDRVPSRCRCGLAARRCLARWCRSAVRLVDRASTRSHVSAGDQSSPRHRRGVRPPGTRSWP